METFIVVCVNINVIITFNFIVIYPELYDSLKEQVAVTAASSAAWGTYFTNDTFLLELKLET